MPPRTRTAAKSTTPRRKPIEPLPSEGVDEALEVINGPDEPVAPVVDDAGRAIPLELQISSEDDDGDSGSGDSDEDMFEFAVDGHTIIAWRPTKEQWGMMMGMMSRASTVADRIHAMQVFAVNVLDETSYLYIETRMLDRKDRFGTKTFSKVLNLVIDHFSPDLNREERRQLARDMRG